jgi:hypothetical protein
MIRRALSQEFRRPRHRARRLSAPRCRSSSSCAVAATRSSTVALLGGPSLPARERVLFLALDEQQHFRDLYALTRPRARLCKGLRDFLGIDVDGACPRSVLYGAVCMHRWR